MKLLSLWTAGIIAAIAIPLLLLLYFLKLRRQERKVSSTLLWKKAIQDLQVNAPFQKLRRNLLLFLQLLILAAVLFGIANPIANLMRRPERNIILLVDRSGSMRTVEADGRTRLEHAQDVAAQFVTDLPDNSRAMVVSFADSPSVVCTFTDDKRRLARLIREIEPTDSPSLLGEALPLAIAYSSNLVEVAGAAGVPDAALEGAADIELFSDGRIADADRQYVTRGQMRYYRIGAATDNVGITAFDVRRDFERPGMLSIFVQVENFGAAPVKTDISLLLDGKTLSGPGAIREVVLGPARSSTTQATTGPAGGAGMSSGQNVVFEIQHEAGGVVEVRLHHKDALAVDNTVFAPIEPPKPTRVLAVSDRWQVRAMFKKLADALSISAFEMMTPAEYESAAEDKLASAGRSAFDLVVMDLHDTQRLPPGNYLFFGGLPKIEGVSSDEEIEGQLVVYGRQDHPLLRNVNYDDLYIAKWRRLILPRHATSLLDGQDSTVMAMLTDPGHRYVIAAFDLLESNFPLKEAFPIFVQNALGYLASGGLVDTHRLVRPGQTLTIPVPPGATEARIRRPDGYTDEIDVGGQSRLTYAKTREVGVYEATFDAGEAKEMYAVNLLDAGESRITPNPEFTVGSEKVAAVAGETKVNEPLWPWAVAAALAILMLEWWVYNKRVMV
ncbi:MAG TPA: VWA domain-containing protein [Phycisphaerae bacterium]|nr:VWA domain-containing protein [Phycisphaerae bacterium]